MTLPNDPADGDLMFGKLDPLPVADAPRLMLASFLDATALPAVKPAVDWYSRVGTWPMHMNDRVGDCTCAEVGHQIESSSTYGQGAEHLVTDADVIALYSAVSGYNGTQATDHGAVIQNVLSYWRRKGIAGHRALAFAQVDHTNHDQVRQALDLFGSLDIGFRVPSDCLAQFRARVPWTVGSHTILGGHSVEAVGFDPAYVYVVTWGRIQRMSWAYWDTFVDEAWAVVLPEWFGSSGRDPQGLDLYALGQALNALTGDPNPFPKPADPPAPPTPINPPVTPGSDISTVTGFHLGPEYAK